MAAQLLEIAFSAKGSGKQKGHKQSLSHLRCKRMKNAFEKRTEK